MLPCDLAARADRAVEAHLRSRRQAGAHQPPQAAGGQPDPGGPADRVEDDAPDRASDVDRGTHAAHHFVAQKLARGRRRTRLPRAGDTRPSRRRVPVEDDRREHADARDPVDDAVVDLHDERESSPGKALHDPRFPERSPAIERPLEDLGAALLELLPRTRLREAPVSQVMAEVEAVVVDPYRIARHGQVLEALAEAWHQRQPLRQVCPDAIDVDPTACAAEVATLEDAGDRQVHVGIGRLESKEALVQSRKPLVAPHRVAQAAAAATAVRRGEGIRGRRAGRPHAVHERDEQRAERVLGGAAGRVNPACSTSHRLRARASRFVEYEAEADERFNRGIRPSRLPAIRRRVYQPATLP